jgi:DNA-directed RNA polymerase subunit RPC12/RpoP
LKTHVTPEMVCPYCSHRVDRASGGGEAPKPGDISVCIDCGKVLVFARDLRLRKPTPAEHDQFNFDPRVIALQATIRSLR